MKTTQRSKQYLEKLYGADRVALVERRSMRSVKDETGTWRFMPGGVSHDAFTIFDLLALDGQPGVLGVQAAAGNEGPLHQRKIETAAATRLWLAAGNRIVVHAWRKVRHGTVAWRWRPRIISARLDGDRLVWDEAP